jgi:tagatose-6-phosphate ketose/aldose isomerase
VPDAATALEELLQRPAAEQEAAGYACTAAEIERQPRVWRATASAALRELDALRAFCRGRSRVVLTGAGSSLYAAAAVASALRHTFPICEAVPSTEIVEDPESALPDGELLLVSFARSGESPEGNAAVALAEELRPGAVRHLAITCNPDGTLARLVSGLGERGRVLLLPPEATDRGLAMTVSATSLAVAGYALACLSAPDTYRAMVEGLAAAADRLIALGADAAAGVASQGFSRAFFLASRPHTAGALEAHLKIQELSAGRIAAAADDPLGFRHGPMVSVDAESLVVLLLSGNPYRRAYELDLLADLRAKGVGRRILTVGPEAPPPGIDYGVHAAVTDAVRAPLGMVAGQLLGLFASLRLGLRPDRPSAGGVINRVVQGVRIHPFRRPRGG